MILQFLLISWTVLPDISLWLFNKLAIGEFMIFNVVGILKTLEIILS